MTQQEHQVLTYHLEQLEDLLTDSAGVQEATRAEGLMHLGAVRKIVTGAHGASSHATRRRRTGAAPPEAGSGPAGPS